MSGMFDDNWGIWRIGIPGFHELDQHLEAPLLPGVRIMVTLTLCFLLLASYAFFLLPFFSLIIYHYAYYSPLILLFLYLHSIGLWALLSLFSCSVLMFGRIAFSCACCLRSLRGFVLQYLLDVLPYPVCCRIRRTIHTPCFCFAIICCQACLIVFFCLFSSL